MRVREDDNIGLKIDLALGGQLAFLILRPANRIQIDLAAILYQSGTGSNAEIAGDQRDCFREIHQSGGIDMIPGQGFSAADGNADRVRLGIGIQRCVFSADFKGFCAGDLVIDTKHNLGFFRNIQDSIAVRTANHAIGARVGPNFSLDLRGFCN